MSFENIALQPRQDHPRSLTVGFIKVDESRKRMQKWRMSWTSSTAVMRACEILTLTRNSRCISQTRHLVLGSMLSLNGLGSQNPQVSSLSFVLPDWCIWSLSTFVPAPSLCARTREPAIALSNYIPLPIRCRRVPAFAAWPGHSIPSNSLATCLHCSRLPVAFS